MGNSTTRPTRAFSPPLSGLQLELLKLYSTGIGPEELLEVKRLLARYFGGKAVESADRVWEERQLTDKNLDTWLDE